MFAYFGYQKLVNYDDILKIFGDPIGIGTALSLQLVIFAEFFCAIFIVAGFLTRLSVIPIFITMVVAYFVAHGKDSFQVSHSAFSYMVFCLPVFVLGSGKYSVDYLLFGRKQAVLPREKARSTVQRQP
jgi:putative oxidoreductase